jgi:hypothetical protein
MIKNYAPSGLHATTSEPQDGRREDLAENIPGGLLVRGSIPLQYFVDPKKKGKALTRFSLWCEKQKKKKKRWS